MSAPDTGNRPNAGYLPQGSAEAQALADLAARNRRLPFGHTRPIILEAPKVSTWGPIIRARYETPRPYTSWCLLLSIPFTGGRSWFDLRFKRFDKR